MLNYILIGLLGSLMAAISQIILKIGAIKKQKSSKFVFFVNVYTAVAYFLMFSVTLINLYIFKYIDLKYALIFLPTTFILVLLFSRIILNEKIEKTHLTGYIIIFLGL